MTFKDHFSKQAADYARYRPKYPDELFDFLARSSAVRALAWDCATGNGQAALGLAQRFERVIATDASAEQIARAEPHPRIEYRVALAENSGLDANSCDLVAVATAAHWFDLDRFYAEVKRVLKPGGMLAIWAYGSGGKTNESSAISSVLRRFEKEIVGPYFPREIQKLWGGYARLPFPFEEISAPQFEIRIDWNLEQLLGCLYSWSGTQKYIEAEGRDPRELIIGELSRAWGDPARTIAWSMRLDFRLGKKVGPTF